MYKLVLASQSPRRRDLLMRAGYEIRVQSVKVSEIIEQNLNPTEAVSHLATKKAQAAFDQYNYLNLKDFLVIGADTLVAFGDKILGKPESEAEAAQFLDLLSGQTHQVLTGFCIIEGGTGRKVVEVDQTLVQFKKLSPHEIKAYIKTGEPMDKAGAYGIQGLGGEFVESYRGSWTNVVGLPMEKFESVLKREGWNVHSRPASSRSE